MCVACSEFIKAKLTSQEFRRALGEISRADPKHLLEVERVMKASPDDPDEVLREKLKKAVKV